MSRPKESSLSPPRLPKRIQLEGLNQEERAITRDKFSYQKDLSAWPGEHSLVKHLSSFIFLRNVFSSPLRPQTPAPSSAYLGSDL